MAKPHAKKGSSKVHDKEADLLSFRETGRKLVIEDLPAEFSLMAGCLNKPLTAEVAHRICERSGTHLLKLVSPRVDGDHSVLWFKDPDSNRMPSVMPSANAPDIPFCKVIYRPLEVEGHPPRSVVDHILNPDALSEPLLSAFTQVFGEDVLEVMKASLLSGIRHSTKLGAGEFPVLFIPRPGGGDLQITPVAPAASFMGMWQVTKPYFQKDKTGAPKLPRGHWHKQAISSQMQNISGALWGSRTRFLATMPPGLSLMEAELFRYIKGGSFPRWRDEGVAASVLRYAKMLESDATYNNQDTRRALDRIADSLIHNATTFVLETSMDARDLARTLGDAEDSLPEAPGVGLVLLRRRWSTDDDHQLARKTLSSPHFDYRLQQRRASREG